MTTPPLPTLTPRELQTIARAVADPRRFDILKHIAAGSCVACADLRTVQDDVTPATLSHHLKELETAGLIELTRRGKFMDITFLRPRWQAYLQALNEL